MGYVGANIYYWGAQEQHQLLHDGLRLWVEEARAGGMIERFWYCPFDVRSPHVFALLRAKTGREHCVKGFLQQRIDHYLETNPSQAKLSAEEIKERHQQCRVTMNSADRLPGAAPNNSCLIFDHESGDYPFQIGREIDNQEELWARWDNIAYWALRHADKDGSVTAVRWLAGVDRALQRTDLVATDYWRFHASTLLHGLEQRLAATENKVEPCLEQLIGRRNSELFSQIWEARAPAEVDVDGLIHFVARQRNLEVTGRFTLLREINHLTLLQLGQIVRVEIPIIAYAWLHNLQLQ